MDTSIAQWTCPSCRAAQASAYCALCGEQQLRSDHLTVRDLARQAFEAFTSLDGKLLRSLWSVIAKPGLLTRDYLIGRRKPYLAPLSLFLIANGLFFAVQSLSHANIFSSPLDSHLHHQDWSAIAQRLVAAKLTADGVSLADYAPVFDKAAVLYAKSLIILIALAFSAPLAAMFWKRRTPIAAHVVFSLHLYAFVLLLFCLCIGVVQLNLLLGGGGLTDPSIDIGLSIFNLAVFAIYLRAATRRVYGAAGIAGLAQTAGLTGVAAALVVAYRFLVFLITLNAT